MTCLRSILGIGSLLGAALTLLAPGGAAAPSARMPQAVTATVVVGGGAPSERQAEAAYDAARRQYGGAVSDGSGAGVIDPANPEVVVRNPYQEVIDGPRGKGLEGTNIALQNIKLVVDVDNTTLRDVFAEIIHQAAAYSGPWTVKWRLKPENMTLLDDRVNLTAEAKFGDFVQLLTERVRNMSGVQLFVTTFQESRVILVTDTYY